MNSHRIGIMTKYIHPTDTKPSRVKAYTEIGHKITLTWDSGLDQFENHEKAAQALMNKMCWKERIIGAAIKDGYAFVMLDKRFDKVKES
jgi:hypothetical protein